MIYSYTSYSCAIYNPNCSYTSYSHIYFTLAPKWCKRSKRLYILLLLLWAAKLAMGYR